MRATKKRQWLKDNSKRVQTHFERKCDLFVPCSSPVVQAKRGLKAASPLMTREVAKRHAQQRHLPPSGSEYAGLAVWYSCAVLVSSVCLLCTCFALSKASTRQEMSLSTVVALHTARAGGSKRTIHGASAQIAETTVHDGFLSLAFARRSCWPLAPGCFACCCCWLLQLPHRCTATHATRAHNGDDDQAVPPTCPIYCIYVAQVRALRLSARLPQLAVHAAQAPRCAPWAGQLREHAPPLHPAATLQRICAGFMWQSSALG